MLHISSTLHWYIHTAAHYQSTIHNPHRHVYPNHTPSVYRMSYTPHPSHPSIRHVSPSRETTWDDITCPTTHHPTGQFVRNKTTGASHRATATCYPRLTFPYSVLGSGGRAGEYQLSARSRVSVSLSAPRTRAARSRLGILE